MACKSPSGLFFCHLPKLDELCSVVVRLTSQTIGSNAAGATQQLHVIRCRELIFTEPDIIGTPLMTEQSFQLIMQQKFFKTGRLQVRIQRMGLMMDKPKRVTSVDFQSCLKYTILARIAPLWNRMANYLVQGRDFLSSRSKLNALEFDLAINEDEGYLILKPSILFLPNIELRDLGIPSGLVREFCDKVPGVTIPEYSIQRKWCHILPRFMFYRDLLLSNLHNSTFECMKKGQIISISHKLPANSPFKFYKDVKKYWKNTYGYRLPEDEDSIFYYQVYFKPVGEILFTYPSVCIRRTDPVLAARPDPQPILDAFFADLSARLPTVCSVKFNISSKTNFAKTKTQNAGKMDVKQKQNISDYNPLKIPVNKNRIMNNSEPSPLCVSKSAPTPVKEITNKIKPVFKPVFKSKPKITSQTIASSAAKQPKIVPMFDKALPSKNMQPKTAETFPEVTFVPQTQESRTDVHPLSTSKIAPSFMTIRRNPNTVPNLHFESGPPATNQFAKVQQKRPAELATTEKAKKPRSKPKVKEGLDVEDLARTNQLAKANAATLQAWLRERGASVKAKEKKADLVGRVLSLLGLPLLK